MAAVPSHLKCRECLGLGYVATRQEFEPAKWEVCQACKGTGSMTGDGELRPVPPHPPDSFVK
jgi:DnaJ-class molecular chaperone